MGEPKCLVTLYATNDCKGDGGHGFGVVSKFPKTHAFLNVNFTTLGTLHVFREVRLRGLGKPRPLRSPV